MADEQDPAQNGATQAPQINQRVLAQYIRDMSFENVRSKGNTKSSPS